MDELALLAGRIAERLVERRETVAIAESSAGGLISAALVAVPGASAFFMGGSVVYTMTAREALLGITKDALAGARSASEPYATILAQTVRQTCQADWGLAETGATGPTGNRYGDAAGHCCLAISGPTERALTLETGSADRAANMLVFAAAALRLLEDALNAG